MTRLMDLAVIKEVTGGRRNRIFANDRYPAIPNKGTEPI